MPKVKKVLYESDEKAIYYHDKGRYYEKLFGRLMRDHPELKKYGTYWEPHGFQEIKVYIPSKGVLIYNEAGTTSGNIIWIEKYIDDKAIKQEERKMRSGMYQKFLSEIYTYQRKTGATQVEIAELTGISRQSINKYMSGIKIPKVSTMRRIADSIGINI